MKKNTLIVVTGISIILFITMACSFDTQKTTSDPAQPVEATMITDSSSENVMQPTSTMESNQPVEEATTPEQENGTRGNYPFPVIDDATNITTSADSVNFQTGMSLNDTIANYRQAFTSQGLSEKTLLTAITASTFSMVFEGSSNGRSLVIQGVDLGNGSTNINIRYEDL